jgi:eukaryotic-like serine/threonine-protein kinase
MPERGGPGDPLAVDQGDDPAETTLTGTGSGQLDTATDGADGSATYDESERVPAPLQYRDPQRYRVIGEHGRGGLGRVLHVHDNELGREIAIKELLADDPVSQLRFCREALITARLEHPGIVPVHEAGRWPDGTLFYSMRLVSGCPLDDVIDMTPELSDRLALIPNIISVADAIAYSHDRRIVHRDLKPSNVVVGAFGDTVVVDWGLAKTIEPPPGSPADELTAPPITEAVTKAGGPIGTPAYMAPEQFTGKADERSDVYSLGGILHHLLSGRPPRGPHIRSEARFAVEPLPSWVPRDLAAIAARAMARDPGRRYPSAREFADDLRRFTIRQPVRARRYSLIERAALVFARHRAVATALVGALIVVAALSMVWVARIRDQRAGAERARDELLLENAELLLASDPTQTAALLDGYRGPDRFARDLLRAQAEGRGLARILPAGHARLVHFVGDAGRGVVSVGADQRVVLSSSAGAELLGQGAARNPSVAFDRQARLLAYSHRGGGAVLVDLAGGRSERIHADMAVLAVALSPGGSQLALLGQDGDVSIVARVGGRERRARVPGARRIAFAGANSLVLVATGSLHVFDLGGDMAERTFTAEIGGAMALDAGRIATGTADGVVEVRELGSMRSLLSAPVCAGAVTAVLFVPPGQRIAFACQSGSAGAIYVATGAVSASFSTERPAYTLAVGPDGRVLAAGGESGAVFLHDFATSITSRRLGHSAPISALAAAGARFISADVTGQIRQWDSPSTSQRIALRARLPVFHSIFSPDGKQLVADGGDGIVRLLDLTSGEVTELAGHAERVGNVRFSPAGDTFASWGPGGPPRMWSAREKRQLRVLDGHRGPVEDLEYLDGKTVLTASSDGRLLSWRTDEPAHELLRVEGSLEMVEALRGLGSAVAASSTGRLYLVSPVGVVRELTGEGAPLGALRAAPDGRGFATGSARGTVRLFGADGKARLLFSGHGPVRHIAFAPDARLVAIATEDGHVHLRAPGGGSMPWTEAPLRARHVEFSPDGRFLAATGLDGSVWTYSLARRAWTSAQPHEAEVWSGSFSPDGRRFASSDGAGVVILHEMADR